MKASLDRALGYALELHANDLRKGTQIPYVSHLLNVSGLVLWDGGSEEEAIAGLLHDALEDHPELTSAGEITKRFGERVAQIVQGCTDTPPDYLGGAKPPWRDRKQGYLRHLRDADPGIRRVSMADKLDNARAILTDYRQIGETLWSRFNAGRDDQLWYLRTLSDVFASGGATGNLVCEFGATVQEIERLCGRY
jgi:(p)ppGpp synthase/HD superfamily hydrolase